MKTDVAIFGYAPRIRKSIQAGILVPDPRDKPGDEWRWDVGYPSVAGQDEAAGRVASLRTVDSADALAENKQ
jgi:hypothetical protein